MRINQVVNSNQPTYDDDGNMLPNGSWSYYRFLFYSNKYNEAVIGIHQ